MEMRETPRSVSGLADIQLKSRRDRLLSSDRLPSRGSLLGVELSDGGERCRLDLGA